MLSFRRITLPQPGLDALIAESLAQGFQFLATLADEWRTGANRFAQPGEALLGAFLAGELVAVGGLNIDPFLADPATGRIRRVYVLAAHRGRGIGGALVQELIQHARPHFTRVRLRAVSPDAARLYQSLGFQPIAGPSATHAMRLTKPTNTAASHSE